MFAQVMFFEGESAADTALYMMTLHPPSASFQR